MAAQPRSTDPVRQKRPSNVGATRTASRAVSSAHVEEEHAHKEMSCESSDEEKAPLESSLHLTAGGPAPKRRKNKRFRYVERKNSLYTEWQWLISKSLTYEQTRYLVGEFSKQAHPDAAHRLRLSKELSGVSPKQIQVWFQNRQVVLLTILTNGRLNLS